jgi:ParB-like chromosome segregation protein Spo0J
MLRNVDKIERVKITRLKPFPGNPRRGNTEAIAASLQEHGLYKPLIAQRSTGHVMVGNNTLDAAQQLGWTEIDVIYKDVDDDRAQRIMLVDNKTSDEADYDMVLLSVLIDALENDYTGTGYDPEEAEQLIALRHALAADGEAADELIELTEVPATGAAYAETPYQEAARAERQAQQTPRQIAGMREIFLVYPEDEHREVTELLAQLREAWGEDIRAPQMVLRLLREAVAALAVR